MASKYELLSAHLRASPGTPLQMKFSEVEALVGALPPSARKHREWWSNNDSHTHARNGWLAAGWKTARVDMDAEQLTFTRVEAGISLRSSSAVHHSNGEQSGLSQVGHRAGGAGNLLEILRAVERYVEGEIVETELGRVVRRFWGRTA